MAFLNDNMGRLLSSTGITTAIRPLQPSILDPLQVPYIGYNPMESELAIAKHWKNPNVGTPFLTNQISSFVVGEGNVWAVPILGTGVAADPQTYAWGVAAVAAAYHPNANAFGAEFNAVAGTTNGTPGDYKNCWALSLAACGQVQGAYPSGYMYMASTGNLGAPQNMIVLRDEGSNPVKNTGSVMVTGFTAGFGGSKHFAAAYGINFLNTTFSNYPFVYGPAATPLFAVDPAGAVLTTQVNVKAAYGTINVESTTQTNAAFAVFKNLAGNFIFGMEASTGATLFTGTTPYAAVAGATGGVDFLLATSNKVRGGFKANGDFVVGNAQLPVNTNDGFIQIPSCVGAPTGTPTLAHPGAIPMIFDKQNMKLYAYVGGAWKASGLFT